MIGKHNRENIKAAVTVAHLFNIDNNTITEAIKKFKPLSHRLQMVGKFRQIIFYDDAISTTPESTILAIESLKILEQFFLVAKIEGMISINWLTLLFIIKYQILFYFLTVEKKYVVIKKYCWN